MELRVSGLTYEQISQQLGVNRSTVHDWVVKEMRAVTKPAAEFLLQVELRRLDALMAAHWAKALSGEDIEQTRTVLRILDDQRSRLQLKLTRVMPH
jgi:orotate phosphoribosyltransferase-like protein